MIESPLDSTAPQPKPYKMEVGEQLDQYLERCRTLTGSEIGGLKIKLDYLLQNFDDIEVKDLPEKITPLVEEARKIRQTAAPDSDLYMLTDDIEKEFGKIVKSASREITH